MLLEVQKLKKEYQRGSGHFFAVDDVDLKVDEEDFICITGRSGSGKSTFLSMIAGLILPTSGMILLDNEDYATLSDDDLTHLRNTKIGYIPQGSSVLSNFSVLDNVRIPFYLSKREGDSKDRALKLLEEVGMLHLADVTPDKLSGGELRRVSIARALINSPRLLIADEPTVNLDVETTKEIMQLFLDISGNGTAILMVSHELDLKQYGNREFVMDAGKLVPN